MSVKDSTAQNALDKSGLSPQDKVEGLRAIVKEVGVGMLTTRTSDGKMASRPMAPAAVEGLVFSHYLNTDSGKTDDITANPDVNLSFYDPKTTDWVSISGRATINQDQSKIEKHWSSSLKAWFDDKKDGKHTGDHKDPRVALVDVIPNEIRWFKAESSMKQWIEVSKAKLTGQAAATGKLVIISKDEIDLVSRTHNTATA